MKTELFKTITKIWVRELFIKPTFISNNHKAGFCLNQCTVRFDQIEDSMEVTYFELSGKHKTVMYPAPKNKEQFVLFLKESCPAQLINRQIKYFSNEL